MSARLRSAPASIALFMLACGGSGTTDEGGSSEATAAADDEGGTTVDATSAGATTGSSAPGTDEGSSAGESSGGGESSSGGPMEPVLPTMLPTPTGTCPTLVDGDVEFAPAGIEPRMVRLWLSDAAAAQDGPLVFYWHGTGSQPAEAEFGLGGQYVDEVVAQGGIIAAPYHDPAAGDFPWWLVLGTREDDLLLADEILACAIEQLGVDVTHIHTAGMSAGGLQTSQMSIRRSGYIASAVPYSGGIISGSPPDQDPSNPLSTMIFHGGADDKVIISFQMASENYQQIIGDRGGFAFICDHGGGHSIPQGSAQASVWKFFLDHPFGTRPSPYVGGLPAGFPEYCAL